MEDASSVTRAAPRVMERVQRLAHRAARLRNSSAVRGSANHALVGQILHTVLNVSRMSVFRAMSDSSRAVLATARRARWDAGSVRLC